MTRNSSDKAINRRIGLGIIGGLATALAGAGSARAAVPITACGYTISTPGNYTLAADLSQCVVNAITITVSNVNLKLDGHIIAGTGTGTDGIVVQGAGRLSNIQIQGPGLVKDVRNGIALVNVDSSQVQGVASEYNAYGLVTDTCTNLKIEENILALSIFSGLSMQGGGDTNDEIQSNNIIGNDTSVGSFVASVNIGGTGLKVHHNNISGGGYVGISIGGTSTNNRIFNNTVAANASVGIFMGGFGNSISNNIVEGNGQSSSPYAAPYYDLYDGNSNCDSNKWHNNIFFTANQACID